MTAKIDGIFWECTELMETLSYHDSTYEAEGVSESGQYYKGIAQVSCGEIQTIEEIEEL